MEDLTVKDFLGFDTKMRKEAPELISEYFRQSGTALPAGPDGQAAEGAPADAGYPAPAPASPDQADTDPGLPRHHGPSAAGPAAAGESARVTADQPRAW
jgi:hypothetical protein